MTKYASLASTHIFCHIATETAMTLNAMVVELVQEIVRRITVINNTREKRRYCFNACPTDFDRRTRFSFKTLWWSSESPS